MLEKFFIGETDNLNWEYINTIPEYQKLAECEQSPIWHSEGNAQKHTLRCIEHAYKLFDKSFYTLKSKRIILVSVLLHDIGKSVSTIYKHEGWHAYGHEFTGESIARRILWDEPIEIREMICAIIRWHMEILRLPAKKDFLECLMRLSYELNINLLLHVKECDIYGSEATDPNDKQRRMEQLNIVRIFSHELDITTREFIYPNNVNGGDIGQRVRDSKNFVFKRKFSWEYIKPKQSVIVMIGLPGAGKDTYINKYLSDENYEIICRDDIRAELGFCKQGEKIIGTKEQEEKVNKVSDEKMYKALNKGKNIVINNMNTKKKYRAELHKKLKKYNIEWRYQYVQAPTLNDNIERRNGQIKPDIFNAIIEKFDWPTPEEYDTLSIHISNSPTF